MRPHRPAPSPARRRSPWPEWLHRLPAGGGLWLLLLLPVLLLVLPGRAEPPGPYGGDETQGLRLSARTASVKAWPALQVFEDAQHRLSAVEVLQRLREFQPPDSPDQNLGQRRATVWLHTWLEVEPDAPERWVAHIDYPLLHDVELHLLDREGQLLQRARTGAQVPFSQRPLGLRAQAAELRLQPGERYQVLLRVRSDTALILPLRFMQWPAVAAHENREQILQGVMIGLSLFMLAYSLTRWYSLRQPMFLAYGAMIVCGLAFWLAFFGVGSQYLWGDVPELAMKMSAGASLPMVAANLLFSLHALELRRSWPRLARVMFGTALFVLAALLLFAAGWLSYRAAAVIGSITGVAHVLVLIPIAVLRWREGDRAALFLALGWLSYIGGLVMITTLLRGVWPANFWTLHGGQLGAAGEMLCWLLVLGLRVEHLREAAERTRREHDLLDALAHTDALTGLANRRGLERALAQGPEASLQDGTLAALYLLDLDGFKQVNDELGHEAGDLVLVTVARRLREVTRQADVLARLGGDEFVVMVRGLKCSPDARKLGLKLLGQFEQPHLLGDGRLHRVGATIGYSLAAGPVRDLAAWLREADAAMYAGKQQGRHTLTCHADLQAAPAGAEAAG